MNRGQVSIKISAPALVNICIGIFMLYREAINSRIKNEGYGGYYSYTPISSISFSQYSSSLAAFSISDSRPAEISLRIKEDI